MLIIVSAQVGKLTARLLRYRPRRVDSFWFDADRSGRCVYTTLPERSMYVWFEVEVHELVVVQYRAERGGLDRFVFTLQGNLNQFELCRSRVLTGCKKIQDCDDLSQSFR